MRTSVGEYVDDRHGRDDLRRMVAIAKKVQAVTGLEVGNSELPFVQRYEPSARFRAHYGERAFCFSSPANPDVGSPTSSILPRSRFPTPPSVRPRAQTCTTWT